MSQRTDRGWQTAGKGAASGASMGAAIGSIVPGIGTAIGAVGGAIIGGVGGYIVGSQPIPQDTITQSQETVFNNLSFEDQYSYNEGFTSQAKVLETRIHLADPDAQTDDFNQIMGIGATLANIYSANSDSGVLET